MLKKINRISSRKEFAEVKNSGEIISTPFFGLVWTKKSEGRAFGTIVSKKISKKAVERNQVRRRLMEAVRLNMEIFPEGFRGIFLVKKNILEKSEMEIAECLKKLF